MDMFTTCQEQKFFRRQDRMLLLYYSKNFGLKGWGGGRFFERGRLIKGAQQ